MHTTFFCTLLLFALCGGLEVGLASEVERREAEVDLEELLDAMQREQDQDSGLNEKEAAAAEYEERNDVFVEKRWRDVYSDEQASWTRQDRVMNSITAEQAASITKLHNKLRGQEGSSNMETLHYNPKLAALAQTWSQRCVFEHGQPPFNPTDIGGYQHLGQNIYAHTDPKFAVEQAVQAWYDEKKDYQYNSMTCNAGKICGHYTAVTWAKTTEVGCGLTFCPSISGLTKAHFIVCNYAPAGNFQGEKPFLKGSPCTQCDSGKFYCNNGLCDGTCNSAGPNCQCKVSCQKCGKPTNDCRCNCQAGTMGPDCSMVCSDKDPKCGANPGLPSFLCTMTDPNWAFVKDSCPKMCGKCKAGNPSGCKKRDMSALKRLMVGFLEKELDEEEEK